MRLRSRAAGRGSVLSVLLAASVVLLLPGVASAASPPIRFSLSLLSPGDCIAVFTDANEPTDVVLRSPDGTIKAQGTLPADELFFCLPDDVWIESGDKLRASDSTYTRNWTIPELSVHSDRVNDLFYGTGPAGRTLRVEWPDGLFADVGRSDGVRVGQDGNWSLEPPNDVIGGLGVSVSWKSLNDDRVSTSTLTPFITLTLGRARFTGAADAFAELDVTLENGPTGSDTVTADVQGAFRGQFRTGGGALVQVSPGDELSAPDLASDADWTVPQVQGEADAPSDMVSGRCHDTGIFSGTAIVEDWRTGHRRGFVFIGTESDGSFEFDFAEVGHFFANPANVKHGDTINVRCLQETGDWVQRRFVVP